MATTNNYTIPRGKIYLALFDANGAEIDGERYFGNTPGFDVSIESDSIEHYSSESAVDELDDEATGKIGRKATITCDNISADNLALFLSGSKGTVTQAATPVLNEVLGPVAGDRYYQLGASSSNPTGARGITTVDAVSAKEGDDASAWGAAAAIAVGDFRIPVTPNSHFYMATVAGTTDASEPTWPTDGSTVSDGTVTWQDMGLIAYVVTTDYTSDLVTGRIYTVDTGAIANASTLAAVSGASINLNADYTPGANSREQVVTSSSAVVSGALRFVADNKKGTNRDLYGPKVNLRPNGSFSMKGEEYTTMQFEATFLKKDSSTEAIYIDGRAA